MLGLLLSIIINITSMSGNGMGTPLANGEFGTPNSCNFTGWMRSGQTSLTTAGAMGGVGSVEAADDCVAKIEAFRNGSTAKMRSTLSQSFIVPKPDPSNPNASRLCVYSWPDKSSPDIQRVGLNQILSLSNSEGVIYSKVNSAAYLFGATFRFTYDLTPYAGQTVTLKAETVIPFNSVGNYSTVLYLDNIQFGVAANCGTQATHDW